MQNFKKYNIIFGWLTFLVAAITYLLTIESSASLWDCGEFIASAYKLQVGHPPGAPFFMIMARFFSLFATDVTTVAKMINAMSGLASAFTILFLFWTITYFARRMLAMNGEFTLAKTITIIGAGVVGALAYTFSDTFWFSAVEGEVYASSSLFTALVFWAILRWESESDKPHATRWIILIAYLMGLSIGVHLLNLLAIPAIVLVYYYKKYQVNRKGIIVATIISIVLLGIIMYGIIPGIVKVASLFELTFVNSFGMPFNSGVLFFSILLVASLLSGIYFTHHKNTNNFLLALVCTVAVFMIGIPLIADSTFIALLITAGIFAAVYYIGHRYKTLINTTLIAFTVIIIGYSSFSMIVIRSYANPPMDENNPETVFSLLSYLNREQYGDRPLFYGQYYNAPYKGTEVEGKVYSKVGDRYEITDNKLKVKYDERFNTFFPRMYSAQKSHINVYKNWADIKGKPIQVQSGNSETETRYCPTFGENLKFFFKYQVGFMYWRYFFWNFAGRQNDIQSHGDLLNGNAITGIRFIDNILIGPDDKMPDWVKHHPARNTYYLLPFLLGLAGLFVQYKKRKEGFWIVMVLFVLTGLAIVVYLNQTPIQPRERDYAYAGSFYAFAVWIGLGVIWLYELFKKVLPQLPGAAVAVGLSLILVPGIMASENWDDHDRSGRYTARAYAYNYLNSCDKNGILFTIGDNDTFPLWYIQDVEGVRTDVRVVNTMLLHTDWYIDQMKRKAYESEAVPFSLEKEQYRQGTRDRIYLQNSYKGYFDVDQAIEWIKSDDPRTKLSYGTEKLDYCPSKKFKIKVDKQKVIENGIVDAADSALIVDEIRFSLKRSALSKSDMMILDLLATNNWERPIYFVSTGTESTLGLENYLEFNGYSYQLVPIETKAGDYLNKGRVKTGEMWNNLMNKFTWGGLENPDVHIDHFNQRNLNVLRIRNMYTRLANELTQAGEPKKAVEALDKCRVLTPHNRLPYDVYVVFMVEAYYNARAFDKGNELAKEYADICSQNMQYYLSFPDDKIALLDNDIRYNIEMLSRLFQTAEKYNQGQTAKTIQNMFESYYGEFRRFMGS